MTPISTPGFTRPHALHVHRRRARQGSGTLRGQGGRVSSAGPRKTHPAKVTAPGAPRRDIQKHEHRVRRPCGRVVSDRMVRETARRGEANWPAAGAGELIGYARCSTVPRSAPGSPRLPGQNRGTQPAGEHAGAGAAAGRAHRRGARPGTGVRDELGGLGVDGDVAAEQHAADDVARRAGRVLRGGRPCQSSFLR